MDLWNQASVEAVFSPDLLAEWDAIGDEWLPEPGLLFEHAARKLGEVDPFVAVAARASGLPGPSHRF